MDFYVNKKKTKKKTFSSVFFIFDKPRIPQNLRKRAIGMLNAGMVINVVAVNIRCSTRAIRHLTQRFQATWRTEDRPRSGRPRVTTRGQDCASRRVAKSPTCAFASSVPQLLLLTPMVHITICPNSAQSVALEWAKCM